VQPVSEYQIKIVSPDLCLHKIVILVDSVETIARIATQFTINVIWTVVNRLENKVGNNT
jgi:hypothetical protein